MKFTILFLFIPIILFSVMLGGGFDSPLPKQTMDVPTPTPAASYIPVNDITPAENNRLQLQTFSFTTIAPTAPETTTTPQETCAGDTVSNNCVCKPLPFLSIGVRCENATNTPSTVIMGGQALPSSQTCPDLGLPCSLWRERGQSQLPIQWQCQANSCLYIKDNVYDVQGSANPNYPKYEAQCASTPICFAKPVIYLYPQTIMSVDVSLEIPGDITISIPQYPVDGWKNVIAYPNGKLMYEGKEYKELFYETSVTKRNVPENGFVFANNMQLRANIDAVLINMGLIEVERQEFLDYWVPRLAKEVVAPYVFVGFLSPEQKESVDKVLITPEPDTRIEMLAYFKGLSLKEFHIQPTIITPKRVGFTMVEWGGTIDKN